MSGLKHVVDLFVTARTYEVASSVQLAFGALDVFFRKQKSFFRFEFSCGMIYPAEIHNPLVLSYMTQVINGLPPDDLLFDIVSAIDVKLALFMALLPLSWPLSFQSVDLRNAPVQSRRLLSYIQSKGADPAQVYGEMLLSNGAAEIHRLRGQIREPECSVIAIEPRKIIFDMRIDNKVVFLVIDVTRYVAQCGDREIVSLNLL